MVSPLVYYQLALLGVSVQSMQKVPISLLCKINRLEGCIIFFSNKISDFLQLLCPIPVWPLLLPR